MVSPKAMLDILGLGEPKAEGQLATVQMDALNTVCSQFADPDKKCLKRKVTELKRGNISDKQWSRDMKMQLEDELFREMVQIEEALEKGKETGLTLSAEEVQKMCKHIRNCHDHMFYALDDNSW